MSTKSETLLRQQYLLPRRSIRKLRQLSSREGVSADEIARRAIEAYTSGRVFSEADEEIAARALLAEIHRTMRASLERIDASLAEVRKRERALDGEAFRTSVREETLAWIGRHPREAERIFEFLSPPAPA